MTEEITDVDLVQSGPNGTEPAKAAARPLSFAHPFRVRALGRVHVVIATVLFRECLWPLVCLVWCCGSFGV
ncbi:hypothetical protein, partial [Nocardia brasiliensis]